MSVHFAFNDRKVVNNTCYLLILCCNEFQPLEWKLIKTTSKMILLHLLFEESAFIFSRNGNFRDEFISIDVQRKNAHIDRMYWIFCTFRLNDSVYRNCFQIICYQLYAPVAERAIHISLTSIHIYTMYLRLEFNTNKRSMFSNDVDFEVVPPWSFFHQFISE